LNREWGTPSEEHSPEVFHVLRKMDQEGCDLFIDVHGDEVLPYNFIAGAEGIPKWGPRLQELQDSFSATFMRHSPDFQDEHGYPTDAAGEANLNIASNAVAERFECLAFTLEQPFKDTVDDPDTEQGWSPERAMRFGAAILGAISDVAPKLR